MKLAICIISYNRPNSVKRVLSSIARGLYHGDSVDLIISIDNSGSNDVADVADKFIWKHGAKIIVKHKTRLGLRAHIIKVGDFTEDYDALIVLEDDVVVAPSFYLYASQAVEKYKDNDMIAGISLYSFHLNYHNWLPFTPISSDSDVYLMQNAQSWGQVWMRRQWQDFKKWYSDNSEDFDYLPHLPKSICSWKRSWLKYHTRYCIENNKYFIYPYVSLSTCFSDAGDHTSSSSTFIQVPLWNESKTSFNFNPTIKYDAFFENISLPQTLGIKSEEICIDLYGEKGNRLNCRYWLTQGIHNFKIMQSFALQLKPLEYNIIYKVEGNSIFLYDTRFLEKNKNVNAKLNFIEYLYNFNSGVKKSFALFKSTVIRYLKSKFK